MPSDPVTVNALQTLKVNISLMRELRLLGSNSYVLALAFWVNSDFPSGKIKRALHCGALFRFRLVVLTRFLWVFCHFSPAGKVCCFSEIAPIDRNGLGVSPILMAKKLGANSAHD
ncbi:MAG: hypothetical protein AAF559_06990 [Pseudomonadota bacterium]